MTIASEILKAQNNLKDCYDVCSSVDGVVLPDEKNFDNLSALIEQALDPLNKPPFNKPADWADIRTDCPENSIALYAGHTADYSQYDNLGFIANCIGGYNVFIDGVQYGSTYASNSQCNITWSTSGITTGDDITTPSALKAHKIWIEPATAGNNITTFKCRSVAAEGTEYQGVLWAHFNIDNRIEAGSQTFSGGSFYNRIYHNGIIKAITAKNNLLKISYFNQLVGENSSLEYLPVLESNLVNDIWIAGTAGGCKKIVVKNYVCDNRRFDYSFANCSKLENIILKNCTIRPNNLQSAFLSAHKLKKIPKEIDYVYAQNMANFLTEARYLEDTVFDASSAKSLAKIGTYGSATYFMKGLKGLRISNEAPFDGTAPQINVNYTGLDRAALVQLFEGLPYNVGYEVVGNPTIVDGVVSGFSNSDYLETSQTLSFSTQQKIEIATKITTGDTVSTSGIIGTRYGNSTFGIYLQGNKPSTMFYYNNGQQAKNNYNSSSVSLNTNTTYYLKAIYDIQNVTSTIMVSTDGINYTSNTKTLEDFVSWYTWINNNAYRIGITQSGTFAGLIDIEETYIKVNDVYWFRGKPSMTKTLSCVGATGTADLTQEDKNIALNKGWAITIS